MFREGRICKSTPRSGGTLCFVLGPHPRTTSRGEVGRKLFSHAWVRSCATFSGLPGRVCLLHLPLTLYIYTGDEGVLRCVTSSIFFDFLETFRSVAWYTLPFPSSEPVFVLFCFVDSVSGYFAFASRSRGAPSFMSSDKRIFALATLTDSLSLHLFFSFFVASFSRVVL